MTKAPHNEKSTAYNGVSTAYNKINTAYNNITTIHNTESTTYNATTTICNEVSTSYNKVGTAYNDITTAYTYYNQYKAVMAFHNPTLDFLLGLLSLILMTFDFGFSDFSQTLGGMTIVR